ncbi:MAG: hypothetical protein ACI8PZ_002545 [Myxococcota bacterium]
MNLLFFARPDGTVRDATGHVSTLPQSVAACAVEVVKAAQFAPVSADRDAFVRYSLWFGDLL